MEASPSSTVAARQYAAPALRIGACEFRWGTRTYVMGIINATPDSFSGDGLGGDPARAAALACQMEAEGAHLLDIGAESSRPGALELGEAEETARLLPSLAAVRKASKLPISVDTYHPSVAARALDEGADAINDIHGLRRAPAMAELAAARGVPVIAMHNQRGRPFGDTASDIRCGFAETVAAATAAGLAPGNLILDPGFGFGWTPEQNLEIVRRLPELWEGGYPLLLGVSRKSTIGLVLGAPAGERLMGTAAMVSLCIAGGADIVRVHDVAAMAQVARMTDAVVRGAWRASS
jgi:dihydropteroate synthase